MLISIGPPSMELLNALLAMAAEEEPSQWSRLKVISAVCAHVHAHTFVCGGIV